MYCSSCGTQIPDDAKFCSKCGRPTAAPSTVIVQNTITMNVEEDRQFHQGVQTGLEIVKRALIAISVYKTQPLKEKYLREAESNLGAAMGVLRQLDEHPKLKGRSGQQRLDAITNDIEYQRFYAAVHQGLGAVEYFHKNYVKAIETFQTVIVGGLPANSTFVVETIKIREGYMNNIRSEDFDSWVKIKREVLKEEINQNELSFFEKRKVKK